MILTDKKIEEIKNEIKEGTFNGDEFAVLDLIETVEDLQNKVANLTVDKIELKIHRRNAWSEGYKAALHDKSHSLAATPNPYAEETEGV